MLFLDNKTLAAKTAIGIRVSRIKNGCFLSALPLQHLFGFMTGS
ncbi:hypothetical protein [Zobellia uliginosa]|nr:hypothetical protein [Zobellia uliginosa]